MRKLTLDVASLRVASFELGEGAGSAGTVRAQDLLAAAGTAAACVSNTNCFTTPCCPETVSCPTPTVIC